MTSYSLQGFYQKAQAIYDQLPPQTRFRLEDSMVFKRNLELFLSWENAVVKGFYDTLYAHSATKVVFYEGERPKREEALRVWYQRTVKGPFNGEYFAWQALVGLIHVPRKVSNGMVLAMWGYVLELVRNQSNASLSPADAANVISAWSRLGATVGAMITESNLQVQVDALSESTGTTPESLQELTYKHITDLAKLQRGK